MTIGAALAHTESTTLDPENPWPGLDAFEEAGQSYFHGRDDESSDLLRLVEDSSLTVLFGKSGLGKTSILRAGLFPLLRVRHRLPVYVRLVVRPGAPSFEAQLAHLLAAEIATRGVDAPPLDEEAPLWEYLHRRPFEMWSRQNFPLVPVFVFDQFEEMFTLGERAPEVVEQIRIAFSDLAENRIPTGLAARIEADPALAASLDLRSMPYKVVVSLREDYLAELEAWRQTAPSLGRVRVRLLPMRVDQALKAVRDTAPHLVDLGVAKRIVEFVSAAQTSQTTADRSDSAGADGEQRGGDIEPALLSLFCRGLNEQRKLQNKPRFDDDLLDSAKQGIISDYYRSCVEGLPDSVSRFIETQLITEKGFRNSYTRDDAVPAHLTAEQLQRLIDRRLLRIEERYGTERIELTHDLLTGAILEHRTQRRAHDAERVRAQQAEEERARLEVENARQRRRVRIAAAVAAICLLFAAAAAYFAFRASQERRRAEIALGISEARELANQSIIAGPTDPVRALELALRGADRAPAKEAEFALRLAVNQSRLHATLPAPAGSHFTYAKISGNGDRLIVVRDDGAVQVRAIPGLTLVKERSDRPAPMGAFFTANLNEAAIVAADSAVFLWNFETGAERRLLPKLAGENFWALQPGPRDRLIRGAGDAAELVNLSTGATFRLRSCGDVPRAAALLGDRVLFASGFEKLLCDGRTGRVLKSVTIPRGSATAAAFSDDGTKLITAGTDEVARIWNTSDASLAGELRGFTAVPMSVALTSGNQALVGVHDGVTEGWRLAEASAWVQQSERVLQLTGVQEGTRSVLSASDGNWIVTLHASSVRVWRGLTAAPKRSVTFRPNISSGVLTGEGHILAAGPLGGVAAEESGGQRRVVAPDRTDSGPAMLQLLSHDRKALLQAWPDGLVRVWSLEPTNRVAEINVGYPLATASWATPSCAETATASESVERNDGTGCAIATLGTNGALKLHTLRPIGIPERHWDVQPGALTPPNRSGRARAVGPGALSPNRTRWVMGADKLSVWDLSAQPPAQRTVNGRLSWEWPFSADGQTVLAYDRWQGFSYLYSLTERLESVVLKGHASPVQSASLSPDRSRVLTWSEDWTARLWDPLSGALLSTMRGHTNGVSDAVFRRDGALIATAAADSTIRVWDPASGTQLFRFDLPSSTPASTPGTLLDFRSTEIAYAKNNMVFVIDCEPCLPVEELKRIARQRLVTDVR